MRQVLFALGALFYSTVCFAQTGDAFIPDPELDQFLTVDIAELTVTSVAKRPQRFTDAPAAIYVVTNDDLRRSGVTSIPEALRMVPGIHVARASSNRWAVTSRGFNSVLANKLLVLIDGRSIYTPVFSGTYWDDQSTLIEDIDRIEVIRGPGASLWGANAVNGIINIITKRAADTQGTYLSAGAGTKENLAEARQGGKAGADGHYRTYVQYNHHGKTKSMTETDNPDDWYRARSGFRVDKEKEKDSYTLQGDVYGGQHGTLLRMPSLTPPFTETTVTEDESYGGNLLARWNHAFSYDSSTSLQMYIDHYTRREANAGQHVSSADVQFQHNLIKGRHNLIWGTGARLNQEEFDSSFAIRFTDEDSLHGVLNAFAQDEYALIPDRLFLTAGSKFEYNSFTGLEVEPSVRIAWHPTEKQTVWGAVSRAVRTPSRIENDVDVAALVLAGPPLTVLRAMGNSEQESEDMIAYELGHRIQVNTNVSVDTALFYNQFDNLQTISGPGTPFIEGGALVLPYSISNLGSGNVYGVEIATNWRITPSWRLTASYTHMQMDLDVEPAAVLSLEGTEELSPRNQFSLRSSNKLTDQLHWDNMFYFVDDITSPVEAYLRYDSRLGWNIDENVEFSITGVNLLDSEHPEFPYTPQAQIERSVLGRLSLRF